MMVLMVIGASDDVGGEIGKSDGGVKLTERFDGHGGSNTSFINQSNRITLNIKIIH